MTESPAEAEARARSRFAIISILRLGGVALVIAALLVLNDKLPLPHLAGWIGLVIDLADIFIVPQMLARAWRTPVP